MERMFSLLIFSVILFSLSLSQARAAQRILTLEELSKQPVNQQQPIIVVNTAAEYVFLNYLVYSLNPKKK